MKKIFTLILFFASAAALLAQNPYVNGLKTGLSNSFDTEADVLNEYVAWGHRFDGFSENMDTAAISWVDGAMKIEAKLGWDYAKAWFLISPDLDETIDITNKYRVSFKYKNLAPADITLVASFRNMVGDDTLGYGGEIWLEGGDVTYGSDDWVTVDMEFTLEDFNLAKVTALEIYLDGQPNGSVIIDDVVFGDFDAVSSNPYVNAAMTGLANSFDTEADVLNEYIAWGHRFDGFSENMDTAAISWVDGAMKIEAKLGWDYAKAWFLISPDLDETIDITNKYRVSFKYKNLAPADITLVASFRNMVGDDTLGYGGEIWLEGGDVTYGSDDWVTVDMEFTLEDFNLAKVTALEIYLDGQPNGSVIIDDVVFGDFDAVSSNPYVNAAMTGLANSFDTEADVLNEYIAWGHRFDGFSENMDTAAISWVDGAMKIEAKLGWDYAKAWFLISPDLDETIDITNKYRVSFKYKNLAPADITLVASFRNMVGDDTLGYGGEIWLEGGDVTYGSDDWVTVDMEFTLEDFNLAKVTALEFYVDGQPDGSVIIDDVVFGDQTTSIEDQIGSSVSEFKVFPNPAYGFIRVEGTGMSNEVNIFNTIGQNVMHIRNRNQIDISSLSKGFYFVVVESKGVRETHKLLVK